MHHQSATDFISAVHFPPVKIEREVKHGIYMEERHPLKQENISKSHGKKSNGKEFTHFWKKTLASEKKKKKAFFS